jgi:transposase-like protein
MIRSEGLLAERRPRRRHALAEKRRIVELTLEPGSSVAQVAQANRVNANRVFKWRRAFERGELVESASGSTALVPIIGSNEPPDSSRSKRHYWGSGLRILDAILAGERTPLTLARLCHGAVKSSEDIIAKSLEAYCRPEHLFALRQSLAAFRYYQQSVLETDGEYSLMF